LCYINFNIPTIPFLWRLCNNLENTQRNKLICREGEYFLINPGKEKESRPIKGGHSTSITES